MVPLSADAPSDESFEVVPMADYGTYFKEKTFYECRSCGIGQLFTRKESYVHFKEHHGKIFDNAKEACYMCCKSFTIGDLKRHYP